MLIPHKLLFFGTLLTILLPSQLHSQGSNFASGEITVRLVEGLDSARDPNGMSQGNVIRSTNPAIPKGSAVLMRLAPSPDAGGFTVQLMQLNVGGQTALAANSGVQLAPDLGNIIAEKSRGANDPKDTVSGDHVFLPQRMVVRFTLTNPPAQAPPVQQVRAPRTPPSPPPPPVKLLADWSVQLASPVTQDVKAACEAADAEHQAYCYGVLLGFYDAGVAAADSEGYKATYCIPSTATVGRLRDAFLDAAKKTPDQLLGPMSIFYNSFLSDAFPCPKAPPKKRSAAKKH